MRIGNQSVLRCYATSWAICAGLFSISVGAWGQDQGSLSAFVPYRNPSTLKIRREVRNDVADRVKASGEFYAAIDASNFDQAHGIYRKAIDENQRFAGGTFKAHWLINSMPNKYDWPAFEKKLETWLKAAPDSSMPAVLLAQAYIHHAWAYRGTGLASSVSPEAWKLFDKYLNAAYDALQSRAGPGARDPAWHTKKVMVSFWTRKAGRDSFESVLAEALSKFPNYYDIYFQGAALQMPRYGGTVARVEALAQEATKRTNAREGDVIYARIYYALDDAFLGNPFRNGMANWPRMKRGFDSILADYPDARTMSIYAKLACQANDTATLKSAMSAVGDQLDMSMWSYVDAAKMDKCFRSLD